MLSEIICDIASPAAQHIPFTPFPGPEREVCIIPILQMRKLRFTVDKSVA